MELRTQVQDSIRHAYATGTFSNLKSQWRSFLRFTDLHHVVPFPASLDTVMLYAQYLGRTHNVQSIKNYVAGVHTLHKYLGLPFPELSEFLPQLFFKGLARLQPHVPRQALPLTPAILLAVHSTLDFRVPLHVVFWAACLVAFFSFLRQSNLLPYSTKFNPAKQLARANVGMAPQGLLLMLTWTKTIQSGGRAL